jgi:hypothetical protein
MTYPNRFTLRPVLCWMGALALAAGVAACGGGSGSDASDEPQAPAATALSGTAAVGAPIAGADVQVRCQGAAAALGTVTTAAGTWRIDTTGQTLPCAVRVTGGSLGQGQAYHAVAVTFGIANITPLTDLMVAHAVGKDPAAWWGSAGPADLSAVTQFALDQALVALRTAFGLEALQDIDPLTAPFAAQRGETIDDVLEALQMALARIGSNYADLVAAARTNGFELPGSLRTALADSYLTITMGGGTTDPADPSNPGPGGNYTLTLDVTASGVATAPIVIENVPKPASEAEFCGWVNDPSSNLSLSQLGNGGAGSLTIESCSFSGNVGRVSATVSITSPVAMTVPYSVVYTYH